jgi:hypothetical protein
LRHGLPKFRLKDHDISAGLSFPSGAPTTFNNPCAANHGNPLQLLNKLGTMLNQPFHQPAFAGP